MWNLDNIPIAECIALGLDVGIYFFCRALLRRHIDILKDIETAPRFETKSELRAYMLEESLRAATSQTTTASEADKKVDASSASANSPVVGDISIPYAVIEGRVEALDAPIASQFLPQETGVIKKFSIKDHKMERRHGLWQEKSDNIQESLRTVPFKIVLNKEEGFHSAALLKAFNEGVEFCDLDKVDNPLHAELDVVYDHFEPASTGFGKALMDNFRGDVSKGIQETEKMLLAGTKVTAIGRIIMTRSRNDAMKMVYPAKDFEFILTKKTHQEIISGYQDAKGIIRIVTYLLGTAGFFLSCLILQRLYKEVMERRQYSLLRQLSEHRRAGDGGASSPTRGGDNAAAASDTLDGTLPAINDAVHDVDASNYAAAASTSPIQDCVVCLSSQRTVILLNCGHVCVCTECASLLPSNRCPVCRSTIDRIQPFFIA